MIFVYTMQSEWSHGTKGTTMWKILLFYAGRAIWHITERKGISFRQILRPVIHSAEEERGIHPSSVLLRDVIDCNTDAACVKSIMSARDAMVSCNAGSNPAASKPPMEQRGRIGCRCSPVKAPGRGERRCFAYRAK